MQEQFRNQNLMGLGQMMGQGQMMQADQMGDPSMMGQPMAQEQPGAAGMESAENETPTNQKQEAIKRLRDKLLLEGRIIEARNLEKLLSKVKNTK